MGSELKASKNGYKLIIDVPKKPLPPVKNVFPVPSTDTLSNTYLIAELVAATGTGRQSIRVRSSVNGLPGGSVAAWKLYHFAYQGSAPSVSQWVEVPITIKAVNSALSFDVYITDPLPNATHKFYLSTNVNGGDINYLPLSISTSSDQTVLTLNQALLDITAVQTAASNAQTTADGAIKSFYQATAPLAGVSSEGDIWFKTSEGNKIYTYLSGVWVATPDSRIAQALLDASTAQGTADGKAKIWYQTTAPTGLTGSDQGDLWVDTDDNYKMYAWTGSAWILAQDWYTANITANNALNITSTILSDGIITKGYEKKKLQADWVTAQSDYTSIIEQAKKVFNNTAGTGGIATESETLKTAYDALSSVASYWSNSTIDTDISALSPTMFTRWSTFYTEIANLRVEIAYRDKSPALYFIVNREGVALFPMDPIPGKSGTTYIANNYSSASFLSTYGVTPVVGKYGLVCTWWNWETNYGGGTGYGDGHTDINIFQIAVSLVDSANFRLVQAPGFTNYGVGFKTGDSFGMEDGSTVVLGGAAPSAITANKISKLAPATSTVLGGVKQGTGVTILADGTLNVSAAGGTTLNGTGLVRMSGATVAYDNSTYLTTTGSAATLTGFPTFNQSTTGYAYSIPFLDTRSTNSAPQTFNNRLSAEFKTNTTDGLVDGGTYHGILNLRQYASGVDWSGGPMHQLAVTDNGNLWQRTSTGSTTWGTWKQYIHSANIGSQTAGAVTSLSGHNISELTNNSGFITGITSGNVTTALGFTPYNSTNPTGFITSAGTSAACSGNAATASVLLNGANCQGVIRSNGAASPNLHLDPVTGANCVYLNYYAGTGGTNFCNGANGVVASINSAGTLSAANFSGSHSGTSSGTNTGDQTNISGNAATATTATSANGLKGYAIPSLVGAGSLNWNGSSWEVSQVTFAVNATTASNATGVTVTNGTTDGGGGYPLTFYTGTLGSYAQVHGTPNITVNPSAGSISATSFLGNATTATTSGSVTSLSGHNISELTNNSGYITSAGNALTATTLQTARTINGVSFNGSANISLTANPINNNITASTDLNTYTTMGFYSCPASVTAASLTNCPTVNAFGMQVAFASGTTQFLWDYMTATAGSNYWMRRFYNTVWGAWVRILREDAQSYGISVSGSAGSVTSLSGHNISELTNNSGFVTSTISGGSAMTGGWNRTLTLNDSFPGIIFGSGASKWSSINYDFSSNLVIRVGATSSDTFGSGVSALSFNATTGAATFGSSIAASNFSGSHSGTSSGTNTGDQINISGNAATATSTPYASEVNAAFGRTDAALYPIAWIANNTNKSQVYSCAAVSIRSSDGTIFSTSLRGSGNVSGTGEAIHCPSGIYASAGMAWLYGGITTNSTNINAGTGTLTVGAINASGTITGNLTGTASNASGLMGYACPSLVGTGVLSWNGAAWVFGTVSFATNCTTASVATGVTVANGTADGGGGYPLTFYTGTLGSSAAIHGTGNITVNPSAGSISATSFLGTATRANGLRRNDSTDNYTVQTSYSADVSGYWSLRGYTPADAYHAPCFVALSGTSQTCSGNAASASSATYANRAINVDVASSGTTGASYFTLVDSFAASKALYGYTSLYCIPATGIYYGVDFSASSDKTLKKDIQPITNAIDKLKQINGVYYKWNELAVSEDKTTIQAGVLAQEVLEVFPEAVNKDDKYLSVSYNKLVPLLIEGLKEQQKEIDELKSIVYTLLERVK